MPRDGDSVTAVNAHHHHAINCRIDGFGVMPLTSTEGIGRPGRFRTAFGRLMP
ncbi:hypothetical protein [Streptomyces apocyni]|uniref:hypothetical protein n=1 Tax=Streptomyces apocyni TaxID=2654677 RepID=UPI0012E9AE5C|nr:hypothetical protein [Streptomyces apocyni]